jgi:NTP pyrophosphatase (non-canonical NTP hydrolase)
MTLPELQKAVHALAKQKGWYDPEHPRSVPELLCLVHSEISEALEEYRDGHCTTRLGDGGKPEGLPIELADAVIRICDMAESLGIDLENAIVAKHAYNRTRPHRHGSKLA